MEATTDTMRIKAYRSRSDHGAFAWPVLLALVSLVSACESERCDGNSETVAPSQTYSNNNYGYSVYVPQGTAGCIARPPLPNHGIRIIVKRSEGALWFNAHFNAGGSESAAEALEDYVQQIKADHAGTKIVSRTASLLGPAPARRAVATYRDARGHDITQVLIVALRRSVKEDDTGIVYVLGLVAPANEYKTLSLYLEEMRRRVTFDW